MAKLRGMDPEYRRPVRCGSRSPAAEIPAARVSPPIRRRYAGKKSGAMPDLTRERSMRILARFLPIEIRGS